MKIGRRIFYDITNGDILIDTGERDGHIKPTTVEQDINLYTVLSERSRETFDYLELTYGQYSQDFATFKYYRVNPKTRQLEFTYSMIEEDIEESSYSKPLSEQLEELKERQDATENVILELLLGGM